MMRNLLVLAILTLTACVNVSSQNANSITFKRGVNISHWIGQHRENQYADPRWFDKSDLIWIAENGYDHIRVPVDGRILMNHDGKLIEELIAPFDRALNWSEELGIGIILDMHYLPGNDFLDDPHDNLLWTSERYQNLAASLWKQLAERYAGRGSILRFEILNEAVAPENEMINVLNKLIVAAIRKVDTRRVLYVSSNLWGQFQTVKDVYVFKDDPNVHYAYHFYQPHVFTHQKARWMVDTRETYPKNVAFPTTLHDLDIFPEDHYLGKFQGVPLNREFVMAKFDELAEWAAANNAKILISEFGVINNADPESTRNWIRAVRDSCEKHGFGWSVWDYQGGFGVRDRNGNPTAVHQGLFD